MPEPLKGKERYAPINSVFKETRTGVPVARVFWKPDVASAIEWLLKRKLGDKLKAVILPHGGEVIVFYKKDFDEAFADVTQNMNKEKVK